MTLEMAPLGAPFAVRVARAEDVDAVASLNTTIQSLHAAHHPAYFKADPSPRRVAELLAGLAWRPGHHVFLAEERKRPIGYVWCEEQEIAGTALTHPLRRFFVHHVGVAADARRRGVAGALLDAVDALARSRGIHRLDLAAWSFNAPARRLFEGRGFAVASENFSKTLSLSDRHSS